MLLFNLLSSSLHPVLSTCFSFFFFSNSNELSTVSSLLAALWDALVHPTLGGLHFLLKCLWHLDLQNLNTLHLLRMNIMQHPGEVGPEEKQHCSDACEHTQGPPRKPQAFLTICSHIFMFASSFIILFVLAKNWLRLIRFNLFTKDIIVQVETFAVLDG